MQRSARRRHPRLANAAPLILLLAIAIATPLLSHGLECKSDVPGPCVVAGEGHCGWTGTACHVCSWVENEPACGELAGCEWMHTRSGYQCLSKALGVPNATAGAFDECLKWDRATCAAKTGFDWDDDEFPCVEGTLKNGTNPLTKDLFVCVMKGGPNGALAAAV